MPEHLFHNRGERAGSVLGGKRLRQPARRCGKRRCCEQVLDGSSHCIYRRLVTAQAHASTGALDALHVEMLIEISRDSEHGPARGERLLTRGRTTVADDDLRALRCRFAGQIVGDELA